MKKSKTVRLPEELIKKISDQAEKEGRSFSNKLTRILEGWSEGKKQA